MHIWKTLKDLADLLIPQVLTLSVSMFVQLNTSHHESVISWAIYIPFHSFLFHYIKVFNSSHSGIFVLSISATKLPWLGTFLPLGPKNKSTRFDSVFIHHRTN